MHKIDIFGKMEGTFYTLNKDGSVQPEPSYHRITDGLTRFYFSLYPDTDFAGMLEQYTHIPVEHYDA